jgi:hypothetical protein
MTVIPVNPTVSAVSKAQYRPSGEMSGSWAMMRSIETDSFRIGGASTTGDLSSQPAAAPNTRVVTATAGSHHEGRLDVVDTICGSGTAVDETAESEAGSTFGRLVVEIRDV